MDRMIYVAMTGAKQIMRAQAVNANNLANISTTGFRADLETIKSLQVYGDGYASRTYSQSQHSGIDLTQGTSITTGKSLDIALSGDGYIAVQTAKGGEGYTRAGNLRVSVNGLLETATGHKVLGNGGPISIPNYEKIYIGSDGTISILPVGQKATALSVVDRIRIVKPDAEKLSKNERGLLVLPQGEPDPVPDITTRVSSGQLESSNVNAIGALINMIDLSRQFEMNVKMMKTAEQNDSSVAQLMRI